MYVLSFSCFCFLGSPPQIKLIQYALVLHFIENMSQLSQVEQNKDCQEISEAAASCEEPSASKNENEKSRDKFKKKKAPGPGKVPLILSSKYPEDDPDYCVWVPPEGQSGDGRTHLNDKYGY